MQPAILDTNVLLLLLVGLYDERFIEAFKRTRKYDRPTFRLVWQFANAALAILVTPQILAEVSNLSLQMPAGRLRDYFACAVGPLWQMSEEHVPKDKLLAVPALHKLGFTDASILEACRTRGCAVLTDDLPLYGILCKNKHPAFNLNHLRGQLYLR